MTTCQLSYNTGIDIGYKQAYIAEHVEHVTVTAISGNPFNIHQLPLIVVGFSYVGKGVLEIRVRLPEDINEEEK